LDYLVGTSRPHLVAAERICIQHVDFAVLTGRHGDLADPCAFENRRIEQSDTSGAKVLITSVQVLIVVWLEVVCKAQRAIGLNVQVNASFAECPASAVASSRYAVVFVRVSIARDKEDSISIGSKRHAGHPNTALARATILTPDVGLRDKRPSLSGPYSDNLLLRDIHTNDYSCVVEEIAVASEATIHKVADLDQSRSLKYGAANEVLSWVIGGT